MDQFPRIPLERQVVSLLSRNREDSFATQRKRGYVLGATARALHERFGLQKFDNLKAKHVAFLVERWKASDTGHRSIDQNLTHLRWLVHKIGKDNLVSRTNAELGIESGPRHTRAGKTVPDARFAEIVGAVTEPRLRAALLLARHLGLRFEEAMLFRPGRDFDGHRVWVKRGTKGGRPRYLFLHNDRQREALQTARRLVTGDGCLIPRECPTYEKWRQQCYPQLQAAGMSRASGVVFHDLRRTYACERMDYLIRDRKMSPDRAAQLVARELGHGRTEVLRWYIAEGGQPAAA